MHESTPSGLESDQSCREFYELLHCIVSPVVLRIRIALKQVHRLLSSEWLVILLLVDVFQTVGKASFG